MTFGARTMKIALYQFKKHNGLLSVVSGQPAILQTPENTLHGVTDLGIHWAIFWSIALRVKHFLLYRIASEQRITPCYVTQTV